MNGFRFGFYLLLAACFPIQHVEGAPAERPNRPTFELATNEVYEFSKIKSYDGEHTGIYDYIDQHVQEHFLKIQ